MTFRQEAASWIFPPQLSIAPVPSTGANAPSTSKLHFPTSDKKSTLLTFLRHCGCPFAEKTFLAFRAAATAHPFVEFIAISHSDRSATDNWLQAIGGAQSVRIIVDSDRELFSQWGLGVSSLWHVLNPTSLWAVYKLGREQGIWNRPTESGSRWQTSGSFAVGSNGVVKWGGAAERADWIPNFEQAVKAVVE